MQQLTRDEAQVSLKTVSVAALDKPFYELAKRILETSIALSILILLLPLWLVIAAVIKLTSDGPVLYKGRVVGKGGREFTYYKFRSMRHNNDNSQHRQFIANYVKASSQQNSGTTFKLTNDKRITTIGKLIRKLSLDEVPQLINVVRGEMAIVGPRPPVPYEYSLYDEWCKQRLTVTPGITGLAQVRARGKASFQQMVEIDFEYIEARSIWLDCKIMLQTPLAMLKGA